MFLLKTINKHGIDMKHVLHIKVGTICSLTNVVLENCIPKAQNMFHVYLMFICCFE